MHSQWSILTGSFREPFLKLISEHFEWQRQDSTCDVCMCNFANGVNFFESQKLEPAKI